ncbi:MAG: hypothetical protein P8Y48_17925 [Novosphingobium sp.]
MVAMPDPLQTVLFWVTLVLASAVCIISLKLARRDNSLVPPLMVVGRIATCGRAPAPDDQQRIK